MIMFQIAARGCIITLLRVDNSAVLITLLLDYDPRGRNFHSWPLVIVEVYPSLSLPSLSEDPNPEAVVEALIFVWMPVKRSKAAVDFYNC